MTELSRPDLLCFGEPLVEFAQVTGCSDRMQIGFGGDVSNVAVAAARQGLKAGMISALGDDPFGTRIRELWDCEGVDHTHVLSRAGGRTGLYFISYGPEGHVFSYARDGSAASRVSSADLPLDAIRAARVFHTSGISQAIGTDPCDATFVGMQAARDAGRLVSYDTNLRLKLWPLDRARAVINAAASQAHIVRPGLDDARLLTGLDHPDDIVDFYLRQGAEIVALTLGAEGCLVATKDRRLALPPYEVEFRDAAGAGDAFTGAFLAAYLTKSDAFAAARYANVAAALQTRGQGAIDPIPTRAEVERALATVLETQS